MADIHELWSVLCLSFGDRDIELFDAEMGARRERNYDIGNLCSVLMLKV